MSERTTGILKMLPKGGGVLRDPARSFLSSPDDASVTPELIRAHGLVEGAEVSGEVQPRQQGRRNWATVDTRSAVCRRHSFKRANASSSWWPSIQTSAFGWATMGIFSMRVVDLIAPIGKGTHGLIVRSTQVRQDHPPGADGECNFAPRSRTSRIIMLLINKRPEEVTHFRRSVPGRGIGQLE